MSFSAGDFATFLQIMGRKGSYSVLDCLEGGPVRFSGLLVETDLSRTILTTRLRELASQGLIERTSHPSVPPHVEYSLTDRGRACLCAFQRLVRAFDAE